MPQMTLEQVKKIRRELEARMEEAGLEMGYKITVKNGKYNEVLTFKIEIAPVRLDGTEVNGETDYFNMRCVKWGIRKEALGQEVTIKGRLYKIIGAQPNAKKYPILLTLKGKRYKFMAKSVREALDPEFRAVI